MCSGRLYIAALRIFLIGPGARHRYQLHLDRRCEDPAVVGDLPAGMGMFNRYAYDGPGKRTEGRRAFECGTLMLVIPLPHKAVFY